MDLAAEILWGAAAAGLAFLGILVYLAIHRRIAARGGVVPEPDPLRRLALKLAAYASVLVAVGQGWDLLYGYLTSVVGRVRLEPVRVARVDELGPGQFVYFTLPVHPDMTPGDHQCMLIRLEPEEAASLGEEFVAYSAVCTHLGCIVQYKPDQDDIYCPCHAGIFDLSGKNVSGPPPRPLPRVEIEVTEDGEVIALGWAGER